jgi:hypothetical protein
MGIYTKRKKPGAPAKFVLADRCFVTHCTGWMRPEKTYRLLGSRLAQQIARHVSYDPEYGFELPCKRASTEAALVSSTPKDSQVPQNISPSHPQQMSLFVKVAKEASFRAAAAWKEQNGWKTKTTSLGKYQTEADASIFAIGMVMRDLPTILSRADCRRAEILSESRPALTSIQSTKLWLLPTVIDIKRQAGRVEEVSGRVVMTWLSNNSISEGSKIADTAAQRAARQQPKEMRSASLLYVQ